MDEAMKVERIVLLQPNDFKECVDSKLLRESEIITTDQDGLLVLYTLGASKLTFTFIECSALSFGYFPS